MLNPLAWFTGQKVRDCHADDTDYTDLCALVDAVAGTKDGLR